MTMCASSNSMFRHWKFPVVLICHEIIFLCLKIKFILSLQAIQEWRWGLALAHRLYSLLSFFQSRQKEHVACTRVAHGGVCSVLFSAVFLPAWSPYSSPPYTQSVATCSQATCFSVLKSLQGFSTKIQGPPLGSRSLCLHFPSRQELEHILIWLETLLALEGFLGHCSFLWVCIQLAFILSFLCTSWKSYFWINLHIKVLYFHLIFVLPLQV